METKKITIKWKGEDAEVEIRKFNAKMRNDIQEKAIDARIGPGGFSGKMSLSILRDQTLMKGIVRAPFDQTNINVIGELPVDVYDQIFNELNDLNNISPEKKEA